MDAMTKIIIFAATSIGILYISRKSILDPHTHGFYRFFVFESVIALFLLNLNYWFFRLFSWNQIISWSLLVISFIPLIFGVRSLTRLGKSAKKREGEENLLAFEKTSNLVTTGIYHFIRHPMYSSLLLLSWGIFFKAPGWCVFLIAVFSTVALALAAKMDEMECIRFFGAEYQEYMKRTKRFIPFLF
jgi:protein-S-isoprenylcysteine O-methyltransferase Ste14